MAAKSFSRVGYSVFCTLVCLSTCLSMVDYFMFSLELLVHMALFQDDDDE